MFAKEYQHAGQQWRSNHKLKKKFVFSNTSCIIYQPINVINSVCIILIKLNALQHWVFCRWSPIQVLTQLNVMLIPAVIGQELTCFQHDMAVEMIRGVHMILSILKCWGVKRSFILGYNTFCVSIWIFHFITITEPWY